jgi:hypothetical protein
MIKQGLTLQEIHYTQRFTPDGDGQSLFKVA